MSQRDNSVNFTDQGTRTASVSSGIFRSDGRRNLLDGRGNGFHPFVALLMELLQYSAGTALTLLDNRNAINLKFLRQHASTALCPYQSPLAASCGVQGRSGQAWHFQFLLSHRLRQFRDRCIFQTAQLRLV
ncbi:hypothetical protein D3C72_1625800 [compost metagenome]